MMFLLWFRTCPEVDQILFLHGRHLLHDSPQPTLEIDQTLGGFSRFVIERRVTDQSLNIDIANLWKKKYNSM